MNHTLGDISRLRGLRTMVRESDHKVAKLSRLPTSPQDETEMESSFAEKTAREIRRLERRIFESEFGLD